MIKNGMTRSDGILALGGGVVGDLAALSLHHLYAWHSLRSGSNQSN
ncbi:MAG: hypothetical protein ACLS5G_01430 [Streptococcus sp.]